MYITAKILMRMISRISIRSHSPHVSADDDKGTVTETTSEIATVYEISAETVKLVRSQNFYPQTPQHPPTQPSTVTPKTVTDLKNGSRMI